MQIENNSEFKAIECLYKNYFDNLKSIDNVLKNNSDLISVRNDIAELSAKVLLIAAANSFEKHLCHFIPDIFSNNNECILHNFLTKQGLNRKYHTLFKWDQDKLHKQGNYFYSLFGDNFKKNIRLLIDKDQKIKKGETDFIILGNERNQITHQGIKFAKNERDIESVYKLYKSSLYFYNFLCNQIINKHKVN